MGTTRLSDIIVPQVFTPYVVQRTFELSRLARAGIIARDPQIDAIAKGGGKTFDMPFWGDLTGESSIASDDPAVKLVTGNLAASQDVAVKHFRAAGWSSMDLTGEIAGSDPARVIADRVADYWARDMQRMLIASLDGVIADNVASDSGDIVINVATDSVDAITSAEKIGPNVVLAAKQTMGDAADRLTAIVMHSALHTELQSQNVIQYLPGATADVGFGTYLGYTVIVDDGCPAVAGTNRITYTSYLFGAGAFGYGEGAPKTPVAVERDELAGNGTGEERLINRKSFILHPRGIKFTSSSVAGVSPTNAELTSAANWDRVYDRKAVRMAAIKTNG